MKELLASKARKKPATILSTSQIIVPITETVSRLISAPNNEIASSSVWAGLAAGFSSNRFSECTKRKKRVFTTCAMTFLSWLTQDENFKRPIATLLPNFTEYELSVLGHRRNSTARVISQLFRMGYFNEDASLTPEQRRSVLALSARQKTHGIKETQPSLSDWFLRIPWLRREMEEAGFENLYLKLESPKVVKRSLEVFCTTLLGEIDRFRTYCLSKKQPTSYELRRDSPIGRGGRTTTETRELISEQLSWFVPLLAQTNLSSPMAEFFFARTYGHHAQLAKRKFIERSDCTLPMRIYESSKQYSAQHPSVFSRFNLVVPSSIEQYLVLNLLAMAAIQPEMLNRLSLENTLIQRNADGRPVAIQFRYSKRRARHLQKETEIYSARSSIGRTLLAYVSHIRRSQDLLDEGDRGFLFPNFRKKTGSLKLPTPGKGGSIAVPNLLVYWLQQPATYDNLCHQYKKADASRVFLEAFRVMMTRCEYSAASARKLTDAQRAESRILPECAWSYTSLKQLGVFARSDQYRVGDLRNVNSHTSETERLSYLNDQNKDWVNRYGRVTRLVIDDMKEHVFNHNVHEVHRKAYERGLRTSVVHALDCDIAEDDVLIHSINPETLEATDHDHAIDGDSFIVLDHPATVVYLLHYLQQAETHSLSLALNAPDFLEQTVAPRCEWMERVLMEKLSPRSVERGRDVYEQSKDRLPGLFSEKLHRV